MLQDRGVRGEFGSGFGKRGRGQRKEFSIPVSQPFVSRPLAQGLGGSVRVLPCPRTTRPPGGGPRGGRPQDPGTQALSSIGLQTRHPPAMDA